uniref:Uncharacterized protein n=1 Tax=Octopus bimaculoides TaxID=37653 RepID=A0A0L8I296_OCTBM
MHTHPYSLCLTRPGKNPAISQNVVVSKHAQVFFESASGLLQHEELAADERYGQENAAIT